MNRLQKQLGEQVRRLRLSRGLTQSQLAEAIGRSTDLLSRVERGQAAPSFDTLESLCGALRVGPSELFGGPASVEAEVGHPHAHLARLLGEMTPEELAWAADLLRLARARPRGT